MRTWSKLLHPRGLCYLARISPPINVGRSYSVDAVLFFHGDGGHFYSSLYLWLGQRMAEQGIAFLTANRRGHDHVANGVREGPLAGYAFESVDDSRADFRALAGAAARARTQPHSHRRAQRWGRAIHLRSIQQRGFANVVAVIPVSPGEYDHEGVIALHGENFLGPFRESERNVEEGHPDALLRPGVPWGQCGARAYVDCFNRDNRYSVTEHAANTGCPTLFIFGSEECAVGGPQELPVCGAARRTLGAASYSHVEVREIGRSQPWLRGTRGRVV